MDFEFKDYLIENEIIFHLTAPGTPQQNGVAERWNRTLLDMVRSMISYSALHTSFWRYTLMMTVHILNVIPSKSIPKIPLELWNGNKLSVRHYRIWRYLTHVLRGKLDKLDSKTDVCLFFGYSKGTQGNMFYSPKEKKVFVSIHGAFLEHDYMANYKPRSKVVLEEMLGDKITHTLKMLLEV